MSATDRKNKLNRRYKVRDFLRRSLTCNYLFMLAASVTGTVLGLYYMINLHLREVLILSQVKNNQIRAVAIAELTSEKLQVEISNIYGAAEQLSDLLSYPEQYQDKAYLKLDNVDSRVEDAYDYASQHKPGENA